MARTRSKKRKRTMRGGITPLEIGIGAGVLAVGIATAFYVSRNSTDTQVSDAYSPWLQDGLTNNRFGLADSRER